MSGNNFDAVVIANPRGANGALGRRWNRLAATIRANFGPFAHKFTRAIGDGTRLTRETLQEGAEMVVAFGGDGTISEVVDGFFAENGGDPINPDAILGVLHYGTGGDFCRTIDVSRKLPVAARQLAGREERRIDVGRLTYTAHDGDERVRHFVNISSFGISGLVDQLVNQSSKALGGRLSFGWATLRAFRQFTPQKARLTFDDAPPKEVTLQTVAVANGRYFGGGMMIAPHAELDDGMFDVVTLGPTSMIDLLTSGHKVYAGEHLDLAHVSATRARRVVAEPVDPREEILLDVDGETPGRLPATFELLPKALRLKQPAKPR